MGKISGCNPKVLKNTCEVTNGKSQEPRKTWWWNEKLHETVKRKKEAFKVWQQNRGDTEKQLYKNPNKAVKKNVAEAKMEAEKDLYDELESKEGQAKIYSIAKIRQRKRQDITEISCIKDSSGKLLVENEEIQNRWKEFYEDLLYIENPSDPLPGAAPVSGPEPEVILEEVVSAIKNMKPKTAGGPSQITADVMKMMDKNAEWLWQITKKLWSEKKYPKDLKRSIMAPIYKQKEMC